ncbi:MAG: M24 family metallopeptidase [Anaerolineae bacterium]|nr:M24 family metallopeptidase [Anaerolineae bacterium]
MKRDIDNLMDARNLDAMMVSGKVIGNPPLIYMLNGAQLTKALLIKKPGEKAHLIVSPMEREEAIISGYDIILNTQYDYQECLKITKGDPLTATVHYYQRIFDDLDIRGRVGVYGHLDQGYAYKLLHTLDISLSDVEFVGEIGINLITEARATKDAAEIERIRDVGKRTVEIVDQTLNYLQTHLADCDQILRKRDGSILTVGDMHTYITQLIGQQGLEDPEGFIFATGAESGIPHSRGSKSKPMKLGQTIVFDIFPREVGGGYFFDFTRTFCLGYAPIVVENIYQDVLGCLQHIQSIIQSGHPAKAYQKAACTYFQNKGYPTIDKTPHTWEGYVHGLGHGVGLDIHESPGFEDTLANTLHLAPGHLFTLEPGLYYPEQGVGCRLEDVMWISENGQIINLTQYPYQLVVPIDSV